MSFWSRLFGGGKPAKLSSLDLFREVYGRPPARSGVPVTWQSALEVSTVLACCRVIAEGVAQIPWKLYQDQGSTRRAVGADNPLSLLISRRPNGWQTSFEFRETLLFHLVLTSNAFVFVNRVGIARTIKELIIIEPGRVAVEQRPDYSLVYKVRAADGSAAEFPQDAIWHLRGPSWNSWMGMDATKLAREAIGLSVSVESHQASFYKNGAKTTGLLSVQQNMGPEKFAFLSAWLDKHGIGGEREGKPLILDLGADYKQFSMSGVDAQTLETRKYQVEEICREFRVMPIMVGYSDKAATYASAEQMFLAHVVHTLSPWYERIEQSANAALFTADEIAAGYYTKFNPNGLMRGAAKDRAEFYKAALGDTQRPGWMVKNEVRALEEMDPVKGGDEFPPLITSGSSAAAPTPGDPNAA